MVEMLVDLTALIVVVMMVVKLAVKLVGLLAL